jgi:uncharacterized membrane protein YozB (DUF420 family)
MQGFLGTGAPFSADANLIVQLAMGAALLIGTFLARKERYTAHGICQTTVMLLNLAMIAIVMWPGFQGQVVPAIPEHLGEPYYAVAMGHASLGMIAELAGLYIVLVARTSIMPRRLRFQRWKLWMRGELVLWWIVVLTGIGTYYAWYLAPPLQ